MFSPPEWLWSWWESAAYKLTSWFFTAIEAIIRQFPEMPATALEIESSFMMDTLYWLGNVIDGPAFSFMITTIIGYELAMLAVRILIFLWRLTPLS